MSEAEAKKTGGRNGIISSVIGLVIAQVIMTWFSSYNGIINGILWFTTVDYKLNILIGVIIFLLCGYFFGGIAGKLILIKGKNYNLTGIICGLVTLITASFLSGITGFCREGIPAIGSADDPFIDYILKPVVWILFFGTIPAIIVGIWFGRKVYKSVK